MLPSLRLRRLNLDELTFFIFSQLNAILPNKFDNEKSLIDRHIHLTLERLKVCINAVKCWEENEFDHLHSSQYCIFLYYLANTIWKETGETELPTKLFLLNKVLNSIDLFYEIEMPAIFFIGHSAGIVLSKAKYSDYLVLYQNSTVGKNHGIAPVIDQGVIMYPNTAIIGRCHISSGSVISQGVSVINQNTPKDCLVFNNLNSNSRLIFKKNKRKIIEDIYRL